MKPEELWNVLEREKTENAQYQLLLGMVNRLEPGYLAALEMLSPAQRQQVEDYVGACEALDDPLIYLAYCVGRNEREGQ